MSLKFSMFLIASALPVPHTPVREDFCTTYRTHPQPLLYFSRDSSGELLIAPKRLPFYRHFLRLRVHADGSRIDAYCIGVVDPYGAEQALRRGQRWGDSFSDKPVLVSSSCGWLVARCCSLTYVIAGGQLELEQSPGSCCFLNTEAIERSCLT